MHCPHCGSNEPEIRIGNKIFCSHCGLPIEKEVATEDIPKPVVKTSNGGELSSAFSQMANTLSGETEATSYKSSDLSLAGGSVKPSQITAESIATVVPPQLKVEPEEVVEKQIETKEKTKPAEELAVSVKTGELPEKAEAEDLAKQIVEELGKEDVDREVPTVDVENLEEEKPVKEVEKRSPGELKAAEKVLDELGKREKQRNFSAGVEKVEQLGAAKKLLDILEDDLEEKETDNKRLEIKKQYEGAEKLLDILEKPEKFTKEKIQKPKSVGSLLDSKKEIESPLATPEISLTKEDLERTEAIEKERGKVEEIKNDTTEDFSIYKEAELPNDALVFEKSKPPEIPEEVKEDIEEELKKIDEKETGDKEEVDVLNAKEGDIPKEEPKEAVDVVTEWENDDTDFDDIEFDSIQGEETEETSEEIPVEEDSRIDEIPIEIAEKEDEKEKKEKDQIHSLGDKKGHIDHWPEEKVVDLDKSHLNENNTEHPLTSYLKDLVEDKRETKKKKKIKKNHKQLKIVAAFGMSVLISFVTIYAYQSLPKADIKEVKNVEIQKVSFSPKELGYIPVGYEESLPIEGDKGSFTTTYSFTGDTSRKITIKQTQIGNSQEKILDDYVKEQSSQYFSETKDITTIYYFDKEVTFEKDKIWYIIRSSKDIDRSELKKMQESLL